MIPLDAQVSRSKVKPIIVCKGRGMSIVFYKHFLFIPTATWLSEGRLTQGYVLYLGVIEKILWSIHGSDSIIWSPIFRILNDILVHDHMQCNTLQWKAITPTCDLFSLLELIAALIRFSELEDSMDHLLQRMWHAGVGLNFDPIEFRPVGF